MIELQHIPLTALAESTFNPRKTFNSDKLAELAESIRVSGVLQPILVRPLPGARAPDTDRSVQFEIVAGARRFRASQLAGAGTIPAILRAMDDDEAMEAAILENLQRDDLTELEEAEGYESLMQHSSLTADQVGEKIGKSRSYVYARLKLLDLCTEARASLRDGTVDASRALLVARIPDHKLQIKAMKEIVQGDYGMSGREPMSYRRALDHVQRNYMLKLSEARFKITAVDLVPEAGSCKTCTKRTGHDPDLFSDVKGADVCTDPPCFHKKEEAHADQLVREAQAKGQTVIAGKEAKEIAINTYGSMPKFKGYKRLDAAEDSPTDVPLRKIIGAQMRVEGIKPVAIAHPTKPGEMIECLPNEVAGRLLKAVEGQAAAAKEVTKEVKALVSEKKAKAEAKAKDKFEQEWRSALVRDTWDELDNHAHPKAFDIKVHRYLAVRAANNLSTDNATAICNMLELGKVSPVSAVVDCAKETVAPDKLHLLIIMQEASSAHEHSYDGRIANEGLLLVAGNVFGDQLGCTIEEIKVETKAKVWPKPEKPAKAAEVAKPSIPLAPAAQANGGRGEGKAQKSPAGAPRGKGRLSAQEAEQGIAAAMQGLETPDSARRSGEMRGADAQGIDATVRHADRGAEPAGAIRYKGPGGETWTGRGQMPKWLRVLKDAGQDIEAYSTAAQEHDLYDCAVELVTREQQASKRLLKEQLNIGQDKALALLERMERNGVVSAAGERQARKVLVAA